MVLSLALGIRDVASGDYIDAAKSLFTIYSWIWYMLYFGLTSMFIGFKAVQLIRDEIDNGTYYFFYQFQSHEQEGVLYNEPAKNNSCEIVFCRFIVQDAKYYRNLRSCCFFS